MKPKLEINSVFEQEIRGIKHIKAANEFKADNSDYSKKLDIIEPPAPLPAVNIPVVQSPLKDKIDQILNECLGKIDICKIRKIAKMKGWEDESEIFKSSLC